MKKLNNNIGLILISTIFANTQLLYRNYLKTLSKTRFLNFKYNIKNNLSNSKSMVKLKTKAKYKLKKN